MKQNRKCKRKNIQQQTNKQIAKQKTQVNLSEKI